MEMRPCSPKPDADEPGYCSNPANGNQGRERAKERKLGLGASRKKERDFQLWAEKNINHELRAKRTLDAKKKVTA